MSEFPPPAPVPESPDEQPHLPSDDWLEEESHGDSVLRGLLEKQNSLFVDGDPHDEDDVVAMGNVTWAIVQRQRELGINPYE